MAGKEEEEELFKIVHARGVIRSDGKRIGILYSRMRLITAHNSAARTRGRGGEEEGKGKSTQRHT